jgi:hypothetical protein
MSGSRFGLTVFLFLLGLALSTLLTIVFWPNFLFFLPLIFFFPWIGVGRKQPRVPARLVCPECDWTTRDESHRFCPKDGTTLTA